jgi:acyl-coenzyme A synthetase/AMP-(fatty) acid ligase
MVQGVDQVVRGRHPQRLHNCIDRHLKKRGDQVAIIWEGDNPYDDKKITYNELHEHVCKLRQCDEEATASRRATASPSTCR